MKPTFRQSMAWLHTWAGVTFGWALFVIMLAGALSVFEAPITEWLRARPSPLWADLFLEPALNAEGLPIRPSERYTYGGQHFVRLHFTFHADMIGIWLVGLITIAMLTAIVSGVITHASIFRDFFTFRPGQGHRSWKDAHTALLVLTLPFLVTIAYSGLVLFHTTYMPAAVAVRYADDPGAFRRESYAPPAEDAAEAEPPRGLTDHPQIYQPQPGARESATRIVRQTMVVLHLAQFGGAPMRWIYFASGLAGAAGVASGLILYVAKRRKRHAESAAPPGRVFAAVERLNVAVIAGLCVASAAYFWGNRLLPLELDRRPGLELTVFFVVWATSLAHVVWRGAERGWREQLALAAGLCAGLPLLSAITSEASLFATLGAQNWEVAGVDLVSLVLAAAFGAIAWRLRRVSAVATEAAAASAHAS